MMEARTGYSLKCVLRRNSLSELRLSARGQECTTRNRKQKYLCRACRRQFIRDYTYQGRRPEVRRLIVPLQGDGVEGKRRMAQVTDGDKNGPALIYCRVSTKALAEGTSLDSQQALCIAHAERLGYTVARVTQEVHTGAELFERPKLTSDRADVRVGMGLPPRGSPPADSLARGVGGVPR